MNENEKKLNENNDETIVEETSVEDTVEIEKDILDEQTGEFARGDGTSNADSPKKKDKKKLFVILAIVIALLIGSGIYGYSTNETKKANAQKTAFDDVTVEVEDKYSETIPLTTEETVLNTKDMVKVLKNGKADENTKITKTDRETIDTSVEGGYTISYTVETLDALGNKATKKYKKTFSVTNEDTEAPVITFKKSLVQINVGDDYDASDNIKSVKDAFEGDIKKVEAIPTEKGTSYYYVDSSKLDTSKKGEYTITVTASDKMGNAIHEDFTVKVKEKSADSTSKETEKSTDKKSSSKSTSSSNKSSNTTTNKSTTSSGSTSSNSGSSSTSSNTNSSTPQKSQTCKTVHHDAITHVVHHDATGHNETYVTKEAWDDKATYVVCRCGQQFGSYNDWCNHMSTEPDLDAHGAYHTETVVTAHHDAEYGTRWVQDTQAYDETVVDQKAYDETVCS